MNEAFQLARLDAFRSACASLGIEATVAVVADDLDAIGAVVNEWLVRSPERLGICAWNGHTAIGVLTSARRLGVGVPERLGVIGCDDTATARLVDPPVEQRAFRPGAGVRRRGRQIAVALNLKGDPTPDSPGGAGVTAVPRASS